MSYGNILRETTDLPDEAVEVIADYVDQSDERFGAYFTKVEMTPEQQKKARAIWSVLPFCLDANKLTQALRQSGFEATSMHNPVAYAAKVQLPNGCNSDYWRGHLITRLSTEGTEWYIDPFWQQFVAYCGGIASDEACTAPTPTPLPRERVLCYQVDDIAYLAEFYAVTVRTLQEKVRRGVLRGSIEAFTRPFPWMDYFTIGEHTLAVPLQPVAHLEALAQQIWDPKRYKAVTDDEIAELKAE